MVTVSANVPGVAKSDLVPIKLAHPLSAERDLQRLGLPLDSVLNTGDTVKVAQAHAHVLITAGYGYGIDPESQEQVLAALGLRSDDADEGTGNLLPPSGAGSAEGQQPGEGTGADAGGSDTTKDTTAKKTAKKSASS